MNNGTVDAGYIIFEPFPTGEGLNLIFQPMKHKNKNRSLKYALNSVFEFASKNNYVSI